MVVKVVLSFEWPNRSPNLKRALARDIDTGNEASSNFALH